MIPALPLICPTCLVRYLVGSVRIHVRQPLMSEVVLSGFSEPLSSLQRFRKTQGHPPVAPPSPDQAKEATCPDCKQPFKVFTEGARGWNTKPHQVCKTCYRVRRQRRRQQPAKVQAVEASEPIFQIASNASLPVNGSTTHKQRRRRRRRSTPTSNSTTNRPLSTRLEHHIFSKGEWRRARLRDHPRVPISISIDKHPTSKNRGDIQTSNSPANVSAIADTGAQSDLWSLVDSRVTICTLSA